MAVRPFDPALRAARQRRAQAMRRQKLLRQVRYWSAVLLLVITLALFGTGAWLMLSK